MYVSGDKFSQGCGGQSHPDPSHDSKRGIFRGQYQYVSYPQPAGGNDYNLEHPMGGLGHAVPKSLPRTAVAEIFEETDTTFLSDPMILSHSQNLPKTNSCSWRRAVTDSGEWQV